MPFSRMTPRERIMAGVDRIQPDRTPFSWGFGPTGEMAEVLGAFLFAQGIDWNRFKRATDDIWSADSFWVGGGLEPGVDIWGIRRRAVRYEGGTYQEISHYPLAGTDTFAGLDAYPWPDPEAFDDTGLRDRLTALDPDRTHAIRVAGGNPFEIYCWMAGLEEALTNLILAPEIVCRALDHITGFFCDRLESMLGAAGDLVDLVFLADDLGGQNGLLFSRKAYKDIIQPYHKRLSSVVHSAHPHIRTLFHSDGAVFDILPDVIDSGMDILEAVQTDADGMDPAALKAAYGDKLSFHGGISVQRTLPFGSVGDVEAECRNLISTLGSGGGFIAAPAHAVQYGTPPENVMAMLRVVLGEDDLARALEVAKP